MDTGNFMVSIKPVDTHNYIAENSETRFYTSNQMNHY